MLVLDDFHLAEASPSIRLWFDTWLRRLPGTWHVVLVTRTEPQLAVVRDLTLRADVLWLRERDLAFTEDETAFWFQPHPGEPGESLNRHQLAWLLERTDGMPMVLSLLWRQWKQKRSFAALERALTESDSVRDQIGQLCLAEIPDDVQPFFIETSVLDPLTPQLCQVLTGREGCGDLLAQSERHGFLVAREERATYTVHPLAREFLLAMLAPARRQELLRRAIDWHLERGLVSRAVGYIFELENEDEVAQRLLALIPRQLEGGQTATVAGWLERLTLQTTVFMPGILHAKGEVARIANRFGESLRFYEQAGESAARARDSHWQTMAALGKARVFLDTIQPSLAEAALREARRLVDRKDRASRQAILQLTFENSINLGRPLRAQRLERTLRSLPDIRPSADNTDARWLLRTGRLSESIELLQSRLSGDAAEQGSRTALSHREATLLLSLLHSMTGDAERAREQALRGLAVGDVLQSPFVQAVGYIRLGHAQHLFDPLSADAAHSYESAVTLMDALNVTRGQAEALMGQCLANAYQHQLDLARACALKGVAIAERVNDTWMASLVRLAYGQACCVTHSYAEAQSVLRRAANDLLSIGDTYLACAALIWLATALHGGDDQSTETSGSFHGPLARALDLACEHGYEHLFLQPTYFGVRDSQQIIRLLQAHTEHGERKDHALRMWKRMDGPATDVQPGYVLRIKTFGNFRVWRGFEEIMRKQWQREKARQLFQFLLTYREKWLHREEIVEALWADLDPEAAERDFKVALNSLALALQPQKTGRGTSCFIASAHGQYRLTRSDLLEVDRDRFCLAIERAARSPLRTERKAALRTALILYAGDYLPEARLGSWSDAERERLQRDYLHAAVEFADLCLEERRHEEAIATCTRALDINPAWEEAYRVLLDAYGLQRNTPLVVQTFRNCKRVMRQEYGVDVSPRTAASYAMWAPGLD